MGSKKSRRLFSRHLIKHQTSLQADLWCTSTKTKERKQFSKDLIDISSGGLSFGSNLEDDIFLPGTFLDKIKIISQEGCLLQASGEVRHIYCNPANSTSPFYKVGVEFEVEFTDEERQYKASLRKQREKITNPVIILDNLKNIVKNRIPVSMENIEYPTHPATIGYFTQLNSSAKFYTLTFEPANQDLSSQLFEELDRLKIMYQLNADGYQFTSVIISQAQDKIVLKLPKSISRLWQRSTLRYIPPLDDPLRLKIMHPMLNGKLLERRVIDLTPNGLSLAIKYSDDLFIKDMLIPRITLIIPGERRINTPAQVKYIGMVMDEQLENYFKCGLSFANLPLSETNFLVSYLLGKCYPHLKDAQGERLETIWDLFYESDFIYEEKREFLAPVVTEVNDTFKKLLKPDNRFYKEIILKEGKKCYGTVSGIWAYERTWIIQHLATIRHPRRFISKDMVLAIADFCSKHPDVEYQKMFWRPDNSWANKTFGKYAHLVADRADLSHLVRYDYLIKSPLDDCQKINLLAGIVIEPLTKSERPLIESYFIARGEFVILQANSLLREEIDLPHTRQMYQQKGLRRERQIYLAKSGQTFLGFVLIEDSSLGINLSGLLNYFKIYTTPECGEIETEIKRGLIQKAITYYKKQGRHFAICLTTDDDLDVYETLGFKKKKEYMCWTFSQKLAQPYFNFVNKFFARIERRLARKISVG